MRSVLFLALPILAACNPAIGPGAGAPSIPPGQVRVVDVSASPDRVVMRLSDRSRCVGVRPEGETGGWSGVTGDCGYALPYTVTFRQGGSASRFVIEDPTGVPVGAGGGPGPRAEVFVTDVDGVRRLFVSGLGSGVRFEQVPPPAT
ncbi:MAG: hypothetical protein WBA25_12765 [Jannaschia sp.]